MEMLDQLTAWLRRNVWCFVVAALLTIFWMAAFWYAGQGAAIATWLSIILAVVVIIYTFFETYRSGQRLSEMRELVREGQDILAIKADELKTETKSMKEIQQKIFDDLQKGPNLTEKTGPPVGPQFRLNIAACKWGQLFGLYCIAKSSKTKHPLDMEALINAIYPNPDITRGSNMYNAMMWQLLGVFVGISCFLEPNSVLVSPNSLKVTKFPNDVADLLSENIQQQLDDPDMSAKDRKRFKNIIDGIDLVVANPPATEKATQ
jgi:hypothetical protein